MSGYLVLRWVSLLLDVTVKSGLLLAGTGACLLLLRRASAASRHLVWLLTFGSLLCLPLLSAALPGWHARAWPHLLPTGAGVQSWAVADGARETPAFRSNAESRGDTDIRLFENAKPRKSETAKSGRIDEEPRKPGRETVGTTFSWSPGFLIEMPVPFRGFALSRFRVLKQSVASLSGQRDGSPPVWPATLCLVWLAGVGAVLAQVGVGIVQVRRLGRRCRRVTEGPLVTLLRALNREVGQQRPVVLRVAEEDSRTVVPMTWGWRRPVVLLPADAAQWPGGRLRSVLLHELAHVRRGDWPVQLLTYATCALYWFHPLVWLAARQIRLESERACDDRVLTAGVPGSDYATHLLEIVRSLRGHRRPLRAALTAAPQSPIERRLRSILETGRSRRAAPRWAVPLAFALAAGTVIPLAGVRPLDERAPRPARRIAAVVTVTPLPVRRAATHYSLVAILETTGHSPTLDRAAVRRPERSPRVAPRKPPPLLLVPRGPRPDRRPLSDRPAVPRPRTPARNPSRLLAALPPAAPAVEDAAPRPAPKPAPEPAPVSAIPADYVRDDSGADDGDKPPVAAAAALVDERPKADAGEPPAANTGPVQLAATTMSSDDTEAAPAPRSPEQATAILPAAGQDRDEIPAPSTATEPADDSCLHWAAQIEAAEQAAARRSLSAREFLVWDPEAGEWVRVLLIWVRPPANGDPGNDDRDAAPEPAVALPEPTVDPASELTEPGVIAQELPLWEQVFDRWEKALAARQHEPRRPCPPAPPAAL